MSVAQVGSVGAAFSTTSPVTGAYGQSPTSGNLLVAVINWANVALETFSPTASTGWARLLPAAVGNNTSGTDHAGVDMWWKAATGGDAAPVFTQTSTSTAYLECNIIELSGANTTAPLDTSGTYSSGTTGLTSPPTMPVTTGAAVAATGEFGIAAWTQDNQSNITETWTEGGSGWTSVFTDGGTSLGHAQINVQANPTSGSTLTDTGHFNNGSANMYSCGAIAVIVAASGGGGGRNLLIPPSGTARFGAYPGSGNAAPTTYESNPLNGSRKLDIVVAYEKWDTVWPGTVQQAQVGAGTGRTALSIRWPCFTQNTNTRGQNAGAASVNVHWTDITAGIWDDIITAAGNFWASYGQPLMVGFSGEFDSTTGQINILGGGDPRNFVPAYQHIHNIIAPLAPNVIWCWVPTGNNQSITASNGIPMSIEVMYPGDSYVDWICADLYGSTTVPLTKYETWFNFVSGGGLVGNTGTGGHNYPAGTGESKPFALLETGVVNTNTDSFRANWITNVVNACQTLDIQLWCYWNDGTSVIDKTSFPLTAAALQSIGANSFFNSVAQGTASLTGAGSLTASSSGTSFGLATLTGAASIASPAPTILPKIPAITGQSSVGSTGTSPSFQASATITASSRMFANTLTVQGFAHLLGAASLRADTVTRPVTVGFLANPPPPPKKALAPNNANLATPPPLPPNQGQYPGQPRPKGAKFNGVYYD